MMNEHFASGLTNEQLKAEILRQGRKANLRLSQLKKTGMYSKNPIISSKWNTFLHENKFATKKNFFKTGSKGETRAEMLKHYVQIRQFLGQKTTVKETRAIMSKHAKRLNISEENVDRVLSIFGNSGISAELPNSDFVQQFIAEMVENGFNDNEINSLLNTLESSAQTQSEMYDLMREQLQMLE
jgi:hypothetical protein